MTSGGPIDDAADSFDSDVDLADPQQRRELATHPALVIAAISTGGVIGALARYGIGIAVPHRATDFPASTLITNVLGSLLIGVLMVALGHATAAGRPARPLAHPLARPFFGVGILGGFTTFSTYAVDAQQLVMHHLAGRALIYLLSTLVLGLAAVAVGSVLTRACLRRTGVVR